MTYYERVYYGDMEDEYDYEPVVEPLLTAAEWRATIDYEAAADMILDEVEIAYFWTPTNRLKLAKDIVDAALGGDDATTTK